MSDIKITTSGELHLNGDIVGRIEWLVPFVESDVAGWFSLDDPFVDEYGARIDCTACGERDEVLTDNERQVRGALRLMEFARKRLAAIGGAGGEIDTKLIEISTALSNMEFEI